MESSPFMTNIPDDPARVGPPEDEQTEHDPLDDDVEEVEPMRSTRTPHDVFTNEIFWQQWEAT